MGVGEKSNNQPMDRIVDSWIIALKRPLKPIKTKSCNKKIDDEDEENSSTTPTSEESRIPRRFTCPPPAPKKRKPSSRCHKLINNGVGEFFNPPDLESVFIRRVET
ncbi:hypothetical protein RND71_008566 [Anisodus tanguticus]|uniref:Uncharacterized protein n=1 Tax=Anisodus tanguticus TaxID=243964 RepID=A0AAE1SNM9_9SOLA|nr:hypothetical protein RND71_008566 [Anisodus tanguticus]